MADTSKIGAPIALTMAKEWAERYRKTVTDPEKERYAHLFGREAIERLLKVPDCAGIRIYYGLNEKEESELMLVAVNEKGDNLLPTTNELDLNDPNMIMDFSGPCPWHCPPNPL
ncbi:MAG: hypothetical protein K2U26_17725 [Cyclobacteriaceae bacterium]|nr:hypothetical protein [Cyclobacteriaceae bacterium]